MNKGRVLEYYRRHKVSLQMVVFVLIAASILMIGLDLRVRYAHNHMTINTVSFFYKRALHLYENGTYLKEDALSLAPQIDKEDYPPFLAYFAVTSYRLTAWLHGLSFNNFISYLPLLLYCLIFFLGFYIMKKLFGLESGLMFICLYSIMLVSVKSTAVGYYTPEALGIFFTLMSLYFFIKSEEKYYFTYLTIISATLLALTYQLFVVFFVVVLARLIIKIRSAACLKRCLLILCVPLILGHIISVYLIKIDYSPFYILREA